MRPAATWGILLGLVLVAGCGGSDRGNSVSAQEISDALTAFSEAFANNDAGALGSFWSETCDPDDVARAEGASQVLSKIFGGEYQFTTGPNLVFEVNGDHVKVPLEQPEGAISATVTINGQEVPFLTNPLPFEAPLELVYEDGIWKVRNCGGLFVEE